jgi:hypothetical protein
MRDEENGRVCEKEVASEGFRIAPDINRNSTEDEKVQHTQGVADCQKKS